MLPNQKYYIPTFVSLRVIVVKGYYQYWDGKSFNVYDMKNHYLSQEPLNQTMACLYSFWFADTKYGHEI